MSPMVPGGRAVSSLLLAVARDAARRIGAEALVILPEEPLDWPGVREACGELRALVAAPSERQRNAIQDAGLTVLDVEPIEATVAERISLALIEAVANDHLNAGARVVVIYSGFEAETLDSITVVRLGEHLERLTSSDLRALETSVPFETLKAVVDIAIEIGREGREGKDVGAMLVIGDARNVISRSRLLGFDPFKGYRRKDRNIRDLKVREAIKEIAQLDGAFVISKDGTVEGACRIIDAPIGGLTLPKGLGTRHWTAAAITKVTKAVAVAVSQSTGAVRIFQDGEIMLRIAPMRHARAMKWTELDYEPAGL
jgi:diadenylate cyclase